MMKKLISILSLFAFTVSASDRITLTITVTNVPSGHNTLTINANVRTWTNSATATPQSLILIGADAGESATNLWNQISRYGYSGPLIPVSFTSSNVITLRGQCGGALAASISGTWASLSLATNTCVDMVTVRVPLSSEPTPSQGTNIASRLVTGLGTHSTNAFATNTTLLSNVVQTDGNQTIAGAKTFSYDTVFSHQISISNAYPYVRLNFYDTSGAADNKWTRIEQGNNLFVIAAMSDAGADLYGITMDPNTGRVQFGEGILTSLFMDGTITNGSIVNSTLTLTNAVSGVWKYTRANHTSLANGNNAGVDFPDYVFQKIKAGPSGAFAICGIVGGEDGRELKLYNATGQNLTIANDSGIDPVAANRIYTGTGSDIATTGNGFVHLIYDSEDSRWVVMNYQP